MTVRSLVYPLLVVCPCAATLVAYGRGLQLDTVVSVVSIVTLAAIAVAERAVPYDRQWNRNDGQWWNDCALWLGGVVVSGGVRVVVRVSLADAATRVGTAWGMTLWPARWPMAAQLAAAVLVVELGLYAGHRALHESAALWRVHVLHHTATRLYHLNNFRIHPLEVILLTVCATAPLTILGANANVVLLAALGTLSFPGAWAKWRP